MNTLVETIARLSDIPGVSGDEGRVRQEIIAQIKGFCEYQTDAAGNLLVTKKGAKTPEKKILFSAHMDEVGLIITQATDSGLLRFATVGGIDNRVILGRSVEIGAARVYGVIGTKATHQLEEKERDEPLAADRLYIDIGALSKDEALLYVQPGDTAVFTASFCRLGENKIMGRAFDDRAGCALLIHMIKSELAYDCSFAFTVQEETGCTGAATAAYSIAPDISFIVEATTAGDIAGTPPEKIVCEQGKGAVISFMDRGTVYDRELYALALQTAQRQQIPCQTKIGVFGGNESKAIQRAGAGVRVLSVNLPCRYLHTANSVLEIADIEACAALLPALLTAAANL